MNERQKMKKKRAKKKKKRERERESGKKRGVRSENTHFESNETLFYFSNMVEMNDWDNMRTRKRFSFFFSPPPPPLLLLLLLLGF